MAQVNISGPIIRNEKIMLKIIDAGYNLTNQQYDPQKDQYTFQITGPDVPGSPWVDLLINDHGRVWCKAQEQPPLPNLFQKLLKK